MWAKFVIILWVAQSSTTSFSFKSDSSISYLVQELGVASKHSNSQGNLNLNGQILQKMNPARKILVLPSQKYVYGFISIPYHPLQRLYSKSSRRSHSKKLSDDDDSVRKRNGTEEGQLYFYKSKGQHILTNHRILDSIVRKSEIRSTDTVLEIGPGTGNLTLKLLEVSKRVVAVEIDKRMVEILHRRVAEHGLQDRFTVICGDALKTEFPQFDLVVANIPYGISSPLVAKLVYGSIPFRSATLLLQKEFARRLLANAGDSEFNRLAVNVKLVADVEYVFDVSKRDFFPCPKVDSAVIIIHPKENVPDVNLDEWWAFTRTCFSKKNKTLGATFKQKKKVMELMQLSKRVPTNCETSEIGNICDFFIRDDANETGINFFKEKIIGVLNNGGFEDKRPSKLSHEELLCLLSLFNQAGIYFHDCLKIRDDADNEVFGVDFGS